MMQRIIKSSINVVLIKFFTLSLSLLFTKQMVKNLGDNDYENYQFLWSFILIIFSFDAGLQNYLRNNILNPKYSKSASELIGSSIVGIFLFSLLIVSIAYSLFAIFGNFYLFNFINENIRYSIFLIPFILALRVSQSIHFASHKPYLNSFFNGIQFILFFVIDFILSAFFSKLQLYHYVSIILLSHLLSAGLSLVYANEKINLNKDYVFKFSIFRKSFPWQYLQLVSVIFLNLSYLLFKFFYEDVEAGVLIVYQYFNYSLLFFLTIISPLWSEVNDNFLNKGKSFLTLLLFVISVVIISLILVSFLIVAKEKLFFSIMGTEIPINIIPDRIYLLFFFSLFIAVSVMHIANGMNLLYRQCYVITILIIAFLFTMINFTIPIPAFFIILSFCNLIFSLSMIYQINKELK